MSAEQDIHIQYFALLREARGVAAETVRTAAPTAQALYEELAGRYGFPLTVQQLQVAVNQAFASWETPLKAGDTVVFIPPVAGG